MNYWEMNQAQTAADETEYPQLQCKEVALSGFTVLFPLVFGAGFGMFGGMTMRFCIEELTWAIRYNYPKKEGLILLLVSLAFLAVSVAAVVVLIKNIMRYSKVKKHGEPVRAKVCGYSSNYNVRVNNRPTLNVNLLVYTPGGWKTLTYQLLSVAKPYAIDSTIEILMYEDLVLIPKKQRHN